MQAHHPPPGRPTVLATPQGRALVPILPLFPGLQHPHRQTRTQAHRADPGLPWGERFAQALVPTAGDSIPSLSRGHLVVSGDMLVWGRESYWHLVGQDQRCGSHPVRHRTASPHRVSGPRCQQRRGRTLRVNYLEKL